MTILTKDISKPLIYSSIFNMSYAEIPDEIKISLAFENNNNNDSESIYFDNIYFNILFSQSTYKLTQNVKIEEIMLDVYILFKSY